VGGFVLQDLLGRGAFGEVYAAQQPGSGRPVALKLLKRSGERELKRFKREAEALSRLDHPGVVKILAHGIDDLPYLALERIEGETLQDRLKGGGLDVVEAVRICAEVAEAVQHMHDMGVVHRDIKPDNLLVEEASGRVKLVDFGLAWFGESTTLTQEGALLGTPHFMAPEQVRPEGRIEKPADVYALGALLYACLTGSPPFAQCKGFQVFTATLHTQPDLPSRFAPDVPRSLDKVCARAMRKRPESRYPSAAEFRQALLRTQRGSRRMTSDSFSDLQALHDPDAEQPPYWLVVAVGAPLVAGVLVAGFGLHPGYALLSLLGLVLLGLSRLDPGKLFQLAPPLARRFGPEHTRWLCSWLGALLALGGVALGVIARLA